MFQIRKLKFYKRDEKKQLTLPNRFYNFFVKIILFFKD